LPLIDVPLVDPDLGHQFLRGLEPPYITDQSYQIRGRDCPYSGNAHEQLLCCVRMVFKPRLDDLDLLFDRAADGALESKISTCRAFALVLRASSREVSTCSRSTRPSRSVTSARRARTSAASTNGYPIPSSAIARTERASALSVLVGRNYFAAANLYESKGLMIRTE
jgi:hypothetical protein